MTDELLMQATLLALTMQNVTGDPGDRNNVILDVFSIYFDGWVIDTDPIEWELDE